MATDVHLLIRLQALDIRILDVRKEIASLPKHIAEIERALESHTRRLEADRAALSANQKDRKRLEGDLQMHEQKISKLRDQMMQAKTNDQYRAFQHEIDFCQTEIRKAEDQILGFMIESERLEQNVKSAEEALKIEKQQVEGEKKVARDRTAEDEAQLAQMLGERDQIVSSLDPRTYSTYERIRKKWHGYAVAEITEERCAACQIAFRPQFFQDLRRGEDLMFCESCGRILVYNPPADFDSEIGSQPSAGGHARSTGL